MLAFSTELAEKMRPRGVYAVVTLYGTEGTEDYTYISLADAAGADGATLTGVRHLFKGPMLRRRWRQCCRPGSDAGTSNLPFGSRNDTVTNMTAVSRRNLASGGRRQRGGRRFAPRRIGVCPRRRHACSQQGDLCGAGGYAALRGGRRHRPANGAAGNCPCGPAGRRQAASTEGRTRIDGETGQPLWW